MRTGAELARLDCQLVWSRDAPSLEAVREVADPGFVLHDQSSPTAIRGPDDYRQYVAAYRSAFPDLTATPDDPVVADGWVLYRRVMVGTHRRTFLGIDPTGEEVSIRTPTLARVREGTLAEAWTPGWRAVANALAGAGGETSLEVEGPDPPGWEGTPLDPDS